MGGHYPHLISFCEVEALVGDLVVQQGFRRYIRRTKVQAILVHGGMGRWRGSWLCLDRGSGVVGVDQGPLFPFRHLSLSFHFLNLNLIYGLVCIDHSSNMWYQSKI